MARVRAGSKPTIGLIAVVAAMVVAVGAPVEVVVDTMAGHGREDSVVGVAHGGMAQAERVGADVIDRIPLYYRSPLTFHWLSCRTLCSKGNVYVLQLLGCRE